VEGFDINGVELLVSATAELVGTGLSSKPK
jgi:hypothetical protein